MNICRHCHERPANYARGLCQRCYKMPAIRHQYPVERALDYYEDSGPVGTPEPTATLSGTVRKKAILGQRAALRQALHHPRDARRDCS